MGRRKSAIVNAVSATATLTPIANPVKDSAPPIVATPAEVDEMVHFAVANKLSIANVYNGISGARICECWRIINNFRLGEKAGGHSAWANKALYSMGLLRKGEVFSGDYSAFEKILSGVDSDAIAKLHAAAEDRFRKSEATTEASIKSVQRFRNAIANMSPSTFHAVSSAIADIRKSRSFVQVVLAHKDEYGNVYAERVHLSAAIENIFFVKITDAKRNKAAFASANLSC